jgi:hypothetical protein
LSAVLTVNQNSKKLFLLLSSGSAYIIQSDIDDSWYRSDTVEYADRWYARKVLQYSAKMPQE